jgi:hypothetical protein
MAVTFSTIAGNIPTTLAGFESQIEALVAKPELTSAELIDLQRMTTEWTLAANTFSTILKTLGDSLRSTLQKIN